MDLIPFPDNVATICYEHFDSLPKKGKPQKDKEWTLLAAIVMSNSETNSMMKVIAMSTGTKCLGETELSSQGDILSDSHAEVLARRAFKRYLFHHIMLILEKKNSDVLQFDQISQKFSLKPGINFHFFVSHIPCGDAAIFQKDRSLDEDYNIEPKLKKFKQDISIRDPAGFAWLDVGRQITDIYRTGAKCVKEGLQDPKAPGKDYHVFGVLRTKPGRGIPTLSMSCSDKIALWNICGLQGALLSHFLETPIYVTSFIFGKGPFDKKAVERAILDRLSSIENLPPSYCIGKPTIMQSSIAFKYSKENVKKVDDKAVPCTSSIIWSDVPCPIDVSVNGKKQGVTKKNVNKKSSRVCICRNMLFEHFFRVIEKISSYGDMYNIFKDNLTYLQCKQLAAAYQTAKKEVFKIFIGWVHKPRSLQNFKCLE